MEDKEIIEEEEIVTGEEITTGEGEDSGVEVAGRPKKDELVEDREVIKETKED